MKIRLISEGKCHNKVAAIKAIRVLCGIGLKEAKDAIEGAMGGRPQDLMVAPAYVASLIEGGHDDASDTLREQGFVFGGIATKRTAVIDSLRAAATVAMAAKDYELSVSIIEVLKKHDHV